MSPILNQWNPWRNQSTMDARTSYAPCTLALSSAVTTPPTSVIKHLVVTQLRQPRIDTVSEHENKPSVSLTDTFYMTRKTCNNACCVQKVMDPLTSSERSRTNLRTSERKKHVLERRLGTRCAGGIYKLKVDIRANGCQGRQIELEWPPGAQGD